MKKNLLILVLLFIVFTSVPESFAQNAGYSAYCVAVIDGDTIKVEHNGKIEKIRLYGVDCPENGQLFGTLAKQKTEQLVYQKSVRIEVMDIDRYKRKVAIVTVGKKVLQEELLKAGLAWHYSKYCKAPFCHKWKQLEIMARQQKIGLWKQKNAIPPWEWRKK